VSQIPETEKDGPGLGEGFYKMMEKKIQFAQGPIIEPSSPYYPVGPG
jgi:hypothetical protein